MDCSITLHSSDILQQIFTGYTCHGKIHIPGVPSQEDHEINPEELETRMKKMALNIGKRNAQAIQRSMKKMSLYGRFQVGTQVLVQGYKWNLKHTPHWSSKAEIIQVFDNYQYAICWITKGPTNEAHDQPGQVSP